MTASIEPRAGAATQPPLVGRGVRWQPKEYGDSAMPASSGYDEEGLPASVWYLIGLGLVAGFLVVSLLAVSLLNAQGNDPAPARNAEVNGKPAAIWVVRAGDTYASIAKNSGLSIELLETFNPRTDPTALVPGQRVKLQMHLPKAAPKPLGPRFWKVRRGQSFGSIAASTGKSMATLRRLNPKVKAAELQPGDRVRLRR